MNRVICGLDIGGTSVKIALVDANQKIIIADTIPTNSMAGKEHFLAAIQKKISEMLTDTQSLLEAIGIGCTGPIDIRTGMILNPYTLPGLEGFSLTDAVSSVMTVPCALDNDSNTAHLGEIALLDAAEIPANTALITFGTGVGCSIRMDHQLFRTPGGIHPEIGHIPVGFQSPIRCYCGKTDCMENVLSGTAINRDALRLFNAMPEEILDHCDTPEKRAFHDALIYALVSSVAILTGIFNSRLIIIAGGMRNFFAKYLIHPAQQKISVLEPVFGGTKLIAAKPNSFSGALGAALFAREEIKRNHG